MLLGCLLTIGAVYVHDTMATSTVASSTTAMSSGAIVNWEVAASEWLYIQEGVHTAWLKLKTSYNG